MRELPEPRAATGPRLLSVGSDEPALRAEDVSRTSAHEPATEDVA